MGGIVLPQTSFLNTKQIKIYDNYIRGLQYYHFNKLEKRIKEGDEIMLKRDLENLHDSFATEVYFQEFKLGYIAAYENIILANMLDQHVQLHSKISKIERSEYQNQIAVEIFAELIIPTDKLITMINLENRADDSTDLYRRTY